MVLADGAKTMAKERPLEVVKVLHRICLTLCKFAICFFLHIELPRCNFIFCASFIVVPKKCSILQIFVNFK